jgi:hypothetical protein
MEVEMANRTALKYRNQRDRANLRAEENAKALLEAAARIVVLSDQLEASELARQLLEAQVLAREAEHAPVDPAPAETGVTA